MTQLPILPSHEDADGVLTLRLPWAPSVNAYWRSHVPKGWSHATVYVSKEGQQYREDVGWLCAGARRFGAAEIEIDIVLYPPDRRARDLDNGLKALLDALQNAQVFENDSQITRLTVTKAGIVSGGSVVVKVWERKPHA